MTPRLELICTGTELLNGRSVNTHARLLARRLAPLGLTLLRETTVPDDRAAIGASVRDALQRSDVILVSGGLGPTEDDCTREAVAEVFNRVLIEDAEALARLATRYARSGRSLNGSRRRQALVIEGAVVLPNAAGAAPGERLDTERGAVFLLPGPTGEVEAVFDGHILPWLAERYPEATVEERVLMVAGIGESDVVDRISAAGLSFDGLTLGYCASPGRVEVRVTGPAGSGDRVDAAAEALDGVLGEDVFSRRREELEEVVGRLLAERELSLATAESCTGGLLSARLTDVAGSSRFFKGGCVSYANEVKTGILGVPEDRLARFGAVSEETAAAMAVGVRRLFGAGIGVSITGIAGPGGGSAEKPVGRVYIGIAMESGVRVRSFQFGRDRRLNREWSVQSALTMLHRSITGR